MSSRESLVENSQYTPILKRITVFACGGVVIDGYLIVMIGIALIQATPALEMSTFWTSAISISALVGIFLGGLIFGYITDLYGRKFMYKADLILLLVCSIAQIFVETPLQLFICRLFLGIGIGADYPIATAMLVEFTPKNIRARMMGVIMSVWYLGAVLAAVVGGLSLSLGPNAWRWMLGSSAILIILLLIGRMNTPESPRWLLSKGRVDEARQIVKQVWGDNADIEDLEETPNTKTKFTKVFQKGYLKRFVFCCTFWSAQTISMYAIYIFSPQILSALNAGEGNAWIWGNMIINLFFFIGCLPALHMVETVGRRPLLIWGFALSIVPFVVLAVVPDPSLMLIVACFCFFAFMNSFPGVLTGVYPTELFPTDIRATAFGLGIAVNRIAVAIGTYLVPIGFAALGTSATLLIVGGAVSLIGLVVSIFMAPETKNTTLKEVSSL